MFNPNDTRMKYDNSSYEEGLSRTIYEGIYQLNSPYNDCSDCNQFMPNDPHIRYQNYGHNSCSMAKAVDDNSELIGLNYKNSKCNKEGYAPNSYISTGCKPKLTNDIRKCSTPTESCRLSNPPCTLKETGINRYEPLCWNPQEKALESFDRIGINYRMVAKDNHTPLIENPEGYEKFLPKNGDINPSNESNLKQWADINQNNNNYSPGYPFNSPNYLLQCNRNLENCM